MKTDTNDAIKKQARKIKTAVHRYGAITVYLDDEGSAHALPGWNATLLGVYTDGARQSEIEADLIAAGARS